MYTYFFGKRPLNDFEVGPVDCILLFSLRVLLVWKQALRETELEAHVGREGCDNATGGTLRENQVKSVNKAGQIPSEPRRSPFGASKLLLPPGYWLAHGAVCR